MKLQSPVLAIVALLTTASAVSAVQSPADLNANAAMTIGKLIGLSTEGARLWASDAVARSDHAGFKRSTQLHQAIGQQLALDRPNRAVLRRLPAEIVAEEARLKRVEQEGLLRIAFRLSDADRKALGRFMVRSAVDDLRESKPVLQPLP